MNKKQKIFYIAIGVFIGILFSAGLAWFAAFQRWVGYSFPSAQYKNGEGVFNPGIPPPIHPSYPSDFSNNQNLIGGTSNVFIAKVLAQTGNKETEIGPRTQYTVEIVQNIKGDLSGVVTLDQLGGYKNGQLVTVEDATLEGYLLQPGSTYLLATRYNEKENWHTLNPHPNASKLLSSDGTKSTLELQTLADQDEKVKSLEAAYPDEKLLDADIAHNNTRNSFQSLPPEAKAAAQARADSAEASLDAGVKEE
jgi:hypothetical protein